MNQGEFDIHSRLLPPSRERRRFYHRLGIEHRLLRRRQRTPQSPRPQFTLRTLLFGILVAALIFGGYALRRQDALRIKQDAEEARLQRQVDALILSIKVPDEAMTWDEASLRRITRLRHDAIARMGIDKAIEYRRLFSRYDMDFAPIERIAVQIREPFWDSCYGSYEYGWIERACQTCDRLATELERELPLGEYLAAHPEIVQQQIRPLVARLLDVNTPEGRYSLFSSLRAQACRALLVMGDRSPRTIATVRRFLEQPNIELSSTSSSGVKSRNWVHLRDKDVAIELNQRYNLGLIASEYPVPAGIQSYPAVPATGAIVSRFRDAPVLQSFADTESLQARIAQDLAASVLLRSVDESSFTLTMDPVQIPNLALTPENAPVCSMMLSSVVSTSGVALDSPNPSIEIPCVNDHLRFQDFHVQETSWTTSQLGQATLLFRLPVTLEATIFKFAADATGSRQRQREIEVGLQTVERNFAAGTLQGDSPERLAVFAFDKSGRALRRRHQTTHSEDGSHDRWFVDFDGVIDQLWVAVAGNTAILDIPAKVDLTKPLAPSVPDQPAAEVRRRYEVLNYREFPRAGLEKFEGAKVKYHWYDRYRGGPYLKYGDEGIAARGDWEVHYFGRDSPLGTRGGGRYEQGRADWWPDAARDRTELRSIGPQIAAVFGTARVQCFSNDQRLLFTKASDGAWVARDQALPTVPDEMPSDLKVCFHQQILTVQGGDLDGLSVIALDETGRQLKLDRSDEPSPGERRHFYWGLPTRCEVTRGRFDDRRFPFEFRFGEIDEVTLREYQEQVETRRPGIVALRQIRRALTATKQPGGNFPQLAALYFLEDESNQPAQLISREIAEACPLGAEIFGYEVAPYQGYVFEVVLAPNNLRPRQAMFKWNGNEIELPLANCYSLVARPVNAKHPTLALNGNAIWQLARDPRSGNDLLKWNKADWTEIDCLRDDSLFSEIPK